MYPAGLVAVEKAAVAKKEVVVKEVAETKPGADLMVKNAPPPQGKEHCCLRVWLR